MQRELVLEADKSVVEGMARAFEAMLDEARQQARLAVEAPAEAVHDFRRSIRRAESVALLAFPLMRKAQRRWVLEGLERARRRTRVLRDLDAVGPVLSRLRELELGEDEAVTALQVWLSEARGEVASDELVAWRLRKNARSLAGLGEIFQVGVHAWADQDLVLESLRETYRQARRAYAKAEKKKKIGEVHAWRRATRTLRYQLELMSSRKDLPAAAAVADAHEVFKGMVKELGQVTDLVALGDLVREAREAVVGVDLAPLQRALGDMIEARVERAFADGALVFALKPSDFLGPISDESGAVATSASPGEGADAKPSAADAVVEGAADDGPKASSEPAATPAAAPDAPAGTDAS